MSSTRQSLFVLVLAVTCFSVYGSNLTRLPDDELTALRKIAKTLGKKDWDFNVDPCSGKSNWTTFPEVKGFENNVWCNCSYNHSSVCHVTSIVLKAQNLQGTLPPEMAQLSYLQEIDFSRNYLNGTIPEEWATLPLVNLSVPLPLLTLCWAGFHTLFQPKVGAGL